MPAVPGIIIRRIQRAHSSVCCATFFVKEPLREKRLLFFAHHNASRLQLSSPKQHRLFNYITKAAPLAACLRDLQSRDSIALDLEFDSHRIAYGTTLCLIQIATPDTCYIIDPMGDLDLSGLYAVFQSEAIQKLVHAPGEDLRVLHGLGCIPQNLFDTDVAAKLLNYEQSSLSAMLFAKLGIILDKGQQRSNWMRRPLSPEQLQYAADDVLHLHPLKAALVADADEKGMLAMVNDEQQFWSTISFAQDEQKDFFLKGADMYASPYDQYVLNGLFCYRDKLARALNKPAFQVMDESLVRGLADGSIQSEELADAKGLYGRYKNEQFARQAGVRLNAIRKEAEAQNLSREAPPKMHSTAEERAAKAQAVRDKTEKFEPVQAALSARFGTFAARYLFSKTKAEEILRGASRLYDLRPAYKPELIRSTAIELGIDLSAYW